MTDAEERYHLSWMGMVQPIEGLVLSVPVLVDAGVMDRTPPEVQERFRAHLVETKEKDGLRLRDLRQLLTGFLGFDDGDLVAGDDVDAALRHYVPEGKQTLAPTLVIKTRDSGAAPPGATRSADAGASAAERTELVVWQLPDGLDFDDAETTTGPWDYPPQHKLDRLLRAIRVPVGLLVNDRALRLVFAPHGESTGAMTFRIDDMAGVGGRPILDAFLSLLSAHRFFGVATDRTLRALLFESRKRQANVTNELAEQVFEALDALLHGFEAANERDQHAARDAVAPRDALRDAMEASGGVVGEHVYGGLLTSMLRLVFLLYAEDRGLMPMENKLYAQHLSVLGLFDQLQQDAGLYPDTMSRRFGAWPRLLALFRTVYEGADALGMPARRGRLFDPNEYPFLEGWSHGGAAPHDVESRAQVQVPSVDDETLYVVLDKLLNLKGQRLSYRALDVEQIGSVYEALMGFRVQRLGSPAACLKGSGVWLETELVLKTAANRREAFVVDESALSKSVVAKIGDALKAATTDDAVLAALEPLRNKKIPVRKAGALVLQPGSERRRTSSHYTPRSLSGPIVEKTLKPLLATMEASGGITAERLLELKICDPAMGSGAFLVEACRFLADAVVKAWTASGALPEIERQHGDPTVHARRLVAQRCLYGVDKNPYAVTLAKLSLWLVSFAKNEPFTFVDHSLRWGDSLVGLSLEQLRRFHWSDAGKQSDWIVDVVTKDLDEAMAHRQRILDLAMQHGSQTAREKEQLLRDADDAARNARLLADVLVGAFFAHDKDKDRERERSTRLTMAQQWVTSQDPPTEQLLAWQAEMRATTPTFHWPIEFPEVFYAGRADPLDAAASRVAWMDAFVGNPPFMGGSQVSLTFGESYRDWLLNLHDNAAGTADIVAHFFRRCDYLLGPVGAFGLVSTNTISQGDSREAGLEQIIRNGAIIYSAVVSMEWPGDAAITVSIVHVAKGPITASIQDIEIDGSRVSTIDSYLAARVPRDKPSPLVANLGKCFNGCKIYGQGFLLEPTEAHRLLLDDANVGRILPYIGGEELNSDPHQSFSRYCISFAGMQLEEAARSPTLLKIVEERVKPGRVAKQNNDIARRQAKLWWRFRSDTPELQKALSGLHRCLALSQVSKHLIVAWQPVNILFSHALEVFAFDHDAHFAILQSRIHERWARLLSSTMRDAGLRYAPSDCFENFPFPSETSRLNEAGQIANTARAKLMGTRNQGLTTTYNQLKNETIVDELIMELRKLHEEMDSAVLDAYGWTDIVVPPYCPTTDAEKKAVTAFEDEVIDRLFALNAERAKEEERLGLGPKKKQSKAKAAAEEEGPEEEKAAPKKKSSSKKEGTKAPTEKKDDPQGGLF